LEKENSVINKQVGAFLLGTAGLVAAISVATAQIAYAIVLAAFYAGNMGGEVPAGPQNANLHWLVITVVITLAAIGLFYLFRPPDKT
jgi:hypothetical protein